MYSIEGRHLMEAKSTSSSRPDELRAHLHGMWAVGGRGVGASTRSTSTRAGARAHGADARALAPAARRARARAGLRARRASGWRRPRASVPGGEVVVSDVAPEMTAIAAARAEALGLTNVTARDARPRATSTSPTPSYDVVLCREGLMFAPDPARAAREIRRVLRPGGRVAVAVWGPRERNPWLGVVLDAVSAQIGAPVPPPGIPGPFSLEDADRARRPAVRRRAGRRGRQRASRAAARRLVRRVVGANDCALAGPLAKMLAALPEDAAQRCARARGKRSADYETAGGLELPGVTLLASGSR